MVAKFFGQWLLEKGAISREDLLAALDLQKRNNLSLGQLAVECDYLTPAQAQSINMEQQRKDRRFGEIATERGLLSDEQVDELLAAQKKRKVFLGQALVNEGALSESSLQAELKAFEQAQREHEVEVKADFESLPHAVTVKAFMETSMVLFSRIVHDMVKVESIQANGGAGEADYYFSQEVQGDKQFMLTLGLSGNHVLAIASKILQRDQDNIDELALDAVAEFLNIVCGNSCVVMGKQGYKLSLQPPASVQAVDGGRQCAEKVVAELVSVHGRIEMSFCFSDA